jgi:hypothetical protein
MTIGLPEGYPAMFFMSTTVMPFPHPDTTSTLWKNGMTEILR